MNIHAGYMLCGFKRASIRNHSAVLGLGKKPTNGVEKKRARTARRIENLLLKRTINSVAYYFCSYPIGCIIFTKSVPLGSIDKGFVQNLKNIALDFG